MFEEIRKRIKRTTKDHKICQVDFKKTTEFLM